MLVVLAVAGATGGAVALTAPTFLSGIAPARAATVLPPPRLVLGPLAAGAPQPVPAALSKALDGPADAVPGKFSGTVLDPATGSVLWERSADRARIPGSTAKLITATAVLLTANPTDTFATRVVAGADPGTVVLVGGGDPTLTALPEDEKSLYPDPARLTELAKKVKATTKVPIERVLIDTSRFTGPRLAESWLPADVPAGYATPMEPLMIDGGRADPSLQDGPRVGRPATVAGRAFAELLGADPDDVAVGKAAPFAKELGTVYSAPFAELVEHMLRTSDNVLADAFAREVAVERGGDPSFSGAAEQTLAALSQAGIDPTGTVLVDGSGLSTENRIPAKVLGAVLAAAAAPAQGPRDTEFLRPILGGLPVAGGDGTLDERFGRDTDAASGRGVVRAKTGSLTGVSSIAGVVTDADGRLLVFALMSNGASPADTRPKLDEVAAALGRCGCR